MNRHVIVDKHPCFSIKANKMYGRVHLPVAKKCNIQCNYCNRKYDCVNESRPGVTSALLSPKQALQYLGKVRDREETISVVGIAGPGDPFANSAETMDTLRMVSKEFSDMIFCLSTNGLNIVPYIEELGEIGLSHVTITVNAIDPNILMKIYSWVRYKKKVYRGMKAGILLLENQLKAIRKLKENGFCVKINTIILPCINEDHIIEVAKLMGEMKADIMNCIAVYPNRETVFGDIKPPSVEKVNEIRQKASLFIPQMTHCARCRADAVGMLGKDNKECQSILKECALEPRNRDRPHVAVATFDGVLVNRHLGETDVLYIFSESEDGYMPVEIRAAPSSGMGNLRWRELANSISDCRALLVERVGENPYNILSDAGLNVIEMSGLILVLDTLNKRR